MSRSGIAWSKKYFFELLSVEVVPVYTDLHYESTQLNLLIFVSVLGENWWPFRVLTWISLKYFIYLRDICIFFSCELCSLFFGPLFSLVVGSSH